MSAFLFDSHAHYDDERFANEFDGGIHGAIKKAYDEGVHGIINVGANLTSSENSVHLAEMYNFVWASVGIHPSDAQRIDNPDTALYQIERLASSERVVAVGEIGLDYHYDDTDREIQAYFFDAQLKLAEKLKLPIVIHSRDAMGDTLDILAKHPNVRGVMHSFSGSAEVASQLCKKGWYISFSGPVTYKNSAKVKEAAAVVSNELILIETDSPYLPPVPHRGKLNYSGYLKHTCQAVADIRGLSFEETAKITWKNSVRMFGINHIL